MVNDAGWVADSSDASGTGSEPSQLDQSAALSAIPFALSRLDRFVVKLISLGIVALGFAVALGAEWYVKPVGVPTVLLGIAVFCYPDPRDHLQLYRRVRDGPLRDVKRLGRQGDSPPE